jgi:hypothetical protein
MSICARAPRGIEAVDIYAEEDESDGLTTKAFYNGGFLARYHKQNVDVASYLMMKKSDVVS